MTLLDDLQAIPVVDHHCHIGMDTYQDSRGRLRNADSHEKAYARGYVESRIGPDAYTRWLDAERRRDAAELADLEGTYGISDLLQRALRYRETTVFAASLADGHRFLDAQVGFDYRSPRARSDVRALFDRTLDLVNCPVVLTDVRAMPGELTDSPRYRWVMRIDGYLYPFPLGRTGRRGEEVESFTARFRADLQARLNELGLDHAPTSFAAYLDFLTSSISYVVANGAVGFKIASAYTRSLAFVPRGYREAESAWNRAVAGSFEDRAIYEDYIAFHVLRQIATWRLPVQIHVGSGHGEPGMAYSGARPRLLQSVFDQPEFFGIPFVLIHGGYPYCSETAIMAHTYGNVYLDFSWMPYLHRTHLVSRLNEWLEFLPANKVIFGTDTGLPEMHVAAVRNGRWAVARALEHGRSNNLWAGDRAMWLAERVLKDNALEIYSELGVAA
ncbi:amidohydrolase family protein [Micromonospora inyonensis]|uniref:Amidohydrolase n=1 Tax=Micromonospora inyonensis TaxID=47866 RepID=A0A1C6SHP3_9ACTN|nr:amidohydrolase family protein [Micromonospora inyonensis]SCL29016.1 Amidohydrolase [Micromonospora inyonensis]